MITRRAVVASSAVMVAVGVDSAFGQVNLPSSTEALGNVVKDRIQYLHMLAAIDALRALLNMILLGFGKESPKQGEDLARYAALRQTLNTPDFQQMLQSRVYRAESKSLIEQAGKQAMPTAKKIESILAEQGIDSKGKAGSALIVGFYQFTQLRAVADQKVVATKESWYCEVYPFSYFCTTG
jgi:hypothetical protein